jgi:hypothetical protein
LGFWGFGVLGFCGLGGLDWLKVRKMIIDTIGTIADSSHTLFIFE